MTIPAKDSLVLYKQYPARVLESGDKLKIELSGNQTKQVRPKDVIPLHPGPLTALSQLVEVTGDVNTAWELLAGETTTLPELIDLVFEENTPAAAWTAWRWVEEGLHFHGVPEQIQVRTEEDLNNERETRERKAREKAEWEGLISRLRAGSYQSQDEEALAGVAALALGRAGKSRVLKELNVQETPEAAHAFLLKLGFWTPAHNPYPERFDIQTSIPTGEFGPLPDEERLDLTHLPAFAIDDEGNQDPDDAISLDGETIWIHVADVAALIPPESQLDLQARATGANLYLPECIWPMLPHEATERLGLGLQEISPALSFGLRFNEEGELQDTRITPSLVKVTRISYKEAEPLLAEEPLKGIHTITQRFRKYRVESGAAMLNLPEVKIQVIDDEVVIRPLPNLVSREMVTDAMLMAGLAAARFAMEHHIAFPFTTQPPPDRDDIPSDMAGMFGFRKLLKPSSTRTIPDPHSGLGLPVYARATSPLRRYTDLLVHQQLRAFLRGESPRSADEMPAVVGEAEMAAGAVRRAERFSNRHWIHVFLQRRPQWKGQGVVMEMRGRRAVVMIPELGMDTQVNVKKELPPNTRIQLVLTSVDLPNLNCGFKMA